MVTDYVIGISLAFLSSVSFGGATAFLSRPLLETDAGPVSFLSVVVGVPLVAIAAAAYGQFFQLQAIGAYPFILFATAGVLHYGLARQGSMEATKNLGANIAAPLLQTQVLYSLLFAVVLLHEQVNFWIVTGTLLVMGGLIFLEGRLSALKRGGRSGRGYGAGISAGLVRGITSIIIAAGLVSFRYFIAATLVAYIASTLFYAATTGLGRMTAIVRTLPRYALYSVVASGLLGAAAQVLRFGALDYSPVVIVVPVTALSSIFTVLFTRLTAREFEVFRPRTIFSVAIIVIGVVMVSLSSGVSV